MGKGAGLVSRAWCNELVSRAWCRLAGASLYTILGASSSGGLWPRKAAAPYWKSSWVVRDPFIRRSNG